MYLGSVSAVPDKTEDSSMTHCPVSRTISFLGVAILVHLIVITSLADRGPSEESQDELPRSKRSVESKHHRNVENTVGQESATRSAVFATENSTVVTAQMASTATLPCTVRKFGTGVVSWIRRKDFQLLTVGLATYSSDDRFMVEHARHLQNWGLQIHKVQKSDAGMYECQVSTHPPTSIFVELKVIEAIADILGSPDLHIKSGSQLRLVCTLRHSTEAPVYVFWYHGDRMINYDKERGVSVRSDRKSSVLAISTADKTDSGNYTCVPSNAKPATINVHVLNGTVDGEKPAAMQHGGRNYASQLTTTTLLLMTSAASLIR
ncbi:junctional adhesion molecule B-like [Macrosteles quadrilineatus]|uniref:junctional adhesion molecule B-like n=1 Tax=Macrosteles quadrilineatus TaxID=74068 RepID=UPI0023E1DF0B|nr:junctional adhesion molecule B-like [Macrosteles quadrilineatus]XP_054278419.1 junctional adhesion molecule B-like [Macrosteles quadrilineatus]